MIALYLAIDPLTFAVGLCAVFTVGCWLLALATGNYSQVDRLWSIAPAVYVCHFSAHAGFADPRLDLMLGLVALWSVRLTYNFARKGGYRRGSEDYRWPEVRARLGPVGFQILHATFLAPFQNALLLLIALPAYVALQARGLPLGPLDAAAASAFIAFLVGETVADEQQWRFQCAKQARRSSGAAAGQGFLTSGLFHYSRHPNFFCEQGMWWSIYVFAVASSGDWLHWSAAGATLLTLLFQGSTRLTEQITLRKYPAYAAYQQGTPRLVPRVRRLPS